jgi:hypothetical protein
MIFDPAIFPLYVNIEDLTPPCPSPVRGEGTSPSFQKGYPLPRGERVEGKVGRRVLPLFYHRIPKAFASSFISVYSLTHIALNSAGPRKPGMSPNFRAISIHSLSCATFSMAWTHFLTT